MARRGYQQPAAEMTARTPVACSLRARQVNYFHQCTGQRLRHCPHSAPVVGRLTLRRNLASLVAFTATDNLLLENSTDHVAESVTDGE